MKRLLTTSAIVVGACFFGVPITAHATTTTCTTDVNGYTICDPASFHVTDSLASGQSPVLLNEATTFNIDDIDNGATIDKPLTIFFAVPTTAAVPHVTDFSFDGGALTMFGGSLSNVGMWTPTDGKGGDLYSFVGCGGCDASINKTNVDAVDGAGTTFNVYSLVINQGFGGDTDFERIDGAFSVGTIIAPLADDVTTNKTTFYDTTWTNAGFVNKQAVIPAPEPSTIAVLGFGLIGTLAAARRKAR